MARSDFRTGLLLRLLRWAGSAGPDSAALHHLDRRMDLAGLAALAAVGLRVADVLPAALAAVGLRVADVLPAALVAADLPVAEEVAADALREAERDADKRRQIVFRLEKLKSSA